MQISELSQDSFNALIERQGISVIYCWAPWCGICRLSSPVFAKVAKHYENHSFVRLNTQEEGALAHHLNIEHVPALVVFRDGVMVFCQAGNYSEADLTDIIAQAESLDMNAVQAASAADQASHPGRNKS